MFQQDWPLYKPSRLYTSAINSPVFSRIEETLADQAKAIDGARSNEISIRNIAVEAHVPVNERRVGRRIQTRARRTRSRGHHRHHDARRERVLDDARARDAVVAAGDERNEWWGPKIGITFGDCTSS